MHRLQISLTKKQYEFLQSEAFISGQSMAGVFRALLDEVIATRRQDILNHDPIWGAIGVAQEIKGPTDVSTNVDKYLYGHSVEVADPGQLSRVAEAADEYSSD